MMAHITLFMGFDEHLFTMWTLLTTKLIKQQLNLIEGDKKGAIFLLHNHKVPSILLSSALFVENQLCLEKEENKIVYCDYGQKKPNIFCPIVPQNSTINQNSNPN